MSNLEAYDIVYIREKKHKGNQIPKTIPTKLKHLEIYLISNTPTYIKKTIKLTEGHERISK